MPLTADRAAVSSRARVWWAIGGLAFLIRLAAGLATGSLWRPEPFEYDDLARSLLAGHGYSYYHLGIVYHAFAAPLYSWICAALYWLTGGSTVGIMILQMAAGAGLAVLAAAMSDHLFESRTAGVIAGVLVACHPGLVVYGALKLHPLTYDALSFSLVLWQFFRLRQRSTLGRAVVLGVIVGVGALTRATTLVFFPTGALWLLWVSPSAERRQTLVRMCVAGLCAVAIVLPWTIRNTRLLHHLVPIQTTDGELIWRGNNPFATGNSYVDAEHTVLDMLPVEARDEVRHLPDEVAQSRWFTDRAMAYIEANPRTFVRLTLKKFFQFWWFSDQTGLLYPQRWLRLYQAYYVALLLLAGAGVLSIAASRSGAWRDALLLVLFLLALSGLQSFYYVEGRHRWAVEPMVIALSGGGAAALIARGRMRVRQ